MYHHVHAHKILSSENFCKKNSGCFKMLTIYYSFAQLWATFATKLMKRSTIFLYILKLRLCVYKFTKFHDQQNSKKKKKKKKKMRPALWTIFSTEMVKNPSIFVTYFSSSFHFLHCHAGLLWLHFYKNYSCFNDANKMLLISKSIFFTPCFSNFLWFTIYFSRYLQFPLNTIMFQKIYITERLLLKIMELENGSFSFLQFWFSRF